eukprot:g6351.t1
MTSVNLILGVALLAASASAVTTIRLRHPSTNAIKTISFDGTKLNIPDHTDKILRLEIKLNELRDEFDQYRRDQAKEDHNLIDIDALQKQVNELEHDVIKTPLKHQAFTCKDGAVNPDHRRCMCNTNMWGGGAYVSGHAYPPCHVCQNIHCSALHFQAGACSTDAGDNFECNPCSNSDATTTCGSNHYQAGSCPGADGRTDGFTCHACSRQNCGAGKYRLGSCHGRIDGYTCHECPTNWLCDGVNKVKAPCDSNYCNNQGTISGNKVDGCSCACHAGWEGATCATSIDDCAAASSAREYGMYDFATSPGGGWDKVDNIAEFNDHKAEFIAFYNANGGVPAINSWTSSNCCWTLRSGNRLYVDNSYIYPHQNGMRCNGAAYSGTFKFWRSSGGHTYDTLSSSSTFSEGTNCADNNNPAIYWRGSGSASKCKNSGTCHDGHLSFTCTCTGGWTGATCETKGVCPADHCNNHGTIGGNQVDGCTCACNSGWEGATCNAKKACPSNHCNGQGTINGNQVDGCSCACHAGWEGATCATSIDDCAAASSAREYGMYDFESSPGGGWDKVDNIAEFNNHKAEFIAFYNANGGVPAINSWSSSNCCWTLRSGKRLWVDNSHIYPHQNGMRCNGAAYSGTFKFWRSSGGHTYDTLSSSSTFSEGTNCADNNNPAIYWRGSGSATKCKNAGTCVDGHNSFTCSCSGGWTGATCETKGACASNHCNNRGT